MARRTGDRSHCPVNYALEAFGDTWSLLIIRDIVFWGKNTYSEFLDSEEHIATNILANRLVHLEKKGIIGKKPHPTDRRKEVYFLTPKGLDLIPMLLEMSGWAACHDSHTGAPKDFVQLVYANRDRMFALIRETIAAGGSVFVGPGSVMSRLAKESIELV